MAVIGEIIIISNGKLSFGDYSSNEKQKVSDFELNGNLYNVKTYRLLTRLEKNNGLLMEIVPGGTVHDLEVLEDSAQFWIEGYDNSQITMELEGSTDYKIYVDNVQVGLSTSSKSGKISFSLELGEKVKEVRVVRV